MKVTTKEYAVKHGLPRYFPNKRCPNGHLCEWYTPEDGGEFSLELAPILEQALGERAAPNGTPPPGIGHNNGPPLADDSLTIPTFLLRGHPDCVLGSS